MTTDNSAVSLKWRAWFDWKVMNPNRILNKVIYPSTQCGTTWWTWTNGCSFVHVLILQEHSCRSRAAQQPTNTPAYLMNYMYSFGTLSLDQQQAAASFRKTFKTAANRYSYSMSPNVFLHSAQNLLWYFTPAQHTAISTCSTAYLNAGEPNVSWLEC